MHLLGIKHTAEKVIALQGFRLKGRKINTCHKATQRCVSSRGYKCQESGSISDLEVLEDFYKGAPSAGLGFGDNHQKQCRDAQHAWSS